MELFILANAVTTDSEIDLMLFIEHNWFQITLIISLIATIIKAVKAFDKYNDENISRHNETKAEIIKIKTKMDEMEEKRCEGSERTQLIMEGLEATLISLHDDGHNGPVTKSLEAMSEYKNRMASK